MKKLNKKGFTIVELVIVIAVIAILAAVLIPTFSNVVTKAKQSAALQEVVNAYKATLADELVENKGTSTLNSDEVVVEQDGIFITIDTNGKASVAGSAATHEIGSDGLLDPAA